MNTKLIIPKIGLFCFSGTPTTSLVINCPVGEPPNNLLKKFPTPVANPSLDSSAGSTSFSERLKPFRLKISDIGLDARQSWRVKLTNGMVIELGRNIPTIRIIKTTNQNPLFIKLPPISPRNRKFLIQILCRNAYTVG